MSIFPKKIYKFNVVPIKIYPRFLSGIRKIIMLIRKNSQERLARSKNKKSKVIAVPNIIF